MARRPRVVIPGVAHHITQRGNNRGTVFYSDVDRHLYTALLARYAAIHHVRILGYCLMPNHVHLIAVPEEEDSLARALKRTHSEYAQLVNRAELRTGHLWQGRYFSCPLDQAHLVTALRYVDLNPVRAGLVDKANDWAWSSALAHGQANVPDPLLDRHWTDLFGTWNFEEWSGMLNSAPPSENTWDDLRRSTAYGSPLGSEEFVARLEGTLGRSLRRIGAGRPFAKSAAA